MIVPPALGPRLGCTTSGLGSCQNNENNSGGITVYCNMLHHSLTSFYFFYFIFFLNSQPLVITGHVKGGSDPGRAKGLFLSRAAKSHLAIRRVHRRGRLPCRFSLLCSGTQFHRFRSSPGSHLYSSARVRFSAHLKKQVASLNTVMRLGKEKCTFPKLSRLKRCSLPSKSSLRARASCEWGSVGG